MASSNVHDERFIKRADEIMELWFQNSSKISERCLKEAGGEESGEKKFRVLL